MRIATLVMTLAFALGVAATAAAAPPAGPSRAADQSFAVQPQDAPVVQLAQAQESPGIDVNVDVSRSGGGGAWYTSPIWIAIFVLGGLLLLVLVAMAARGGGGAPQGTTIVK